MLRGAWREAKGTKRDGLRTRPEVEGVVDRALGTGDAFPAAFPDPAGLPSLRGRPRGRFCGRSIGLCAPAVDEDEEAASRCRLRALSMARR